MKVDKPGIRRIVVRAPSDVAKPNADREISLEAFQALLLELTGQSVPAIFDTLQSDPRFDDALTGASARKERG